MAPLVYLCVRPQAAAAAGEYASFREAMGLDESGLERWDLVSGPVPADAFTRWRGFVVGGSPFNVTDPESSKTDVQRRLEADLARVAEHDVQLGMAFLDGTNIRAHQKAAGASRRKTRPKAEGGSKTALLVHNEALVRHLVARVAAMAPRPA